MNPQDAILNCFLKLSYVTDSHTLVHQYRKGHIEIDNFIEIVHRQDPSISRYDISNFYSQSLKEARFSLMTQFVLDKIFKKAGQIRAQQTNDHPLRSPEELLQSVAQSIKLRKLDLHRVFKVFDRDQDLTLNEKEFQTFVEYYIPTLTPEEFRQIRTKYPNKIITLDQLESWMGEGCSQSISMQPSNNSVYQQPNKQLSYVPQQSSQPWKQNPLPVTPEVEPTVITNPQIVPSNSQGSSKKNLFKQSIGKMKAVTTFKNSLLNHRVKGLADFQEMFHKYEATKELFIDKEFPATKQSLGPKTKEYPWKRISELWGDKHSVFQKGDNAGLTLKDLISADDIGQGELGDCYFLSALASVAFQMPEVIQDLFITQKVNQSGVYAVKFCVDGAWQLIVIDDLIPTIGRKPAFSQSAYFESWVIILEKAWAKLHGSYSNIIGGLSTEVFKSVTCGPTWTLITDDHDFKQRFQECFRQHCFITVGTNRAGSDYKDRGLVPGHAYSILRMDTVRHPQLGVVDLVKIRNPWGKVEWNGDWGDKSSLWTPELKKQLDIHDKDDGEFYMSYTDFISHYHSVFAGYYQKTYPFESLTQVIKKKNSAYFIFEIAKDGEYYFTAYQKSERRFRSQYQNYKYSPIRILLGSFENRSYQYCASACKTQSDLYVGGQLKKGTYVAQVKIPWNYWPEYEFNVSVYGQLAVEIKQIPKIPTFTEQVMISKARQNLDRSPISDDQPQVLKSQELKGDQGLGYLYFINESNKSIQLDWGFNRMVGLKLKKPHRGNNINITIPPGKDAIVIQAISQTVQ